MAELTDAAIIEMYQSGMSLKKIALCLGRSIRRPERVIKKAGIMRPWGASGPQHSQWKGGRLNAGQGYYRVWVAPDDPMASMRDHHGYVKEHRLNMARKLGRPLLRTETVHHINGIRDDNRPENLELRQGRHGKHVIMYCMDCGSHKVGHAPLGQH